MRHPKSSESWDAEFRAGKYEFLKKPSEQARLAPVVSMIAHSIEQAGPCEVVDIGCGEGILYHHLPSSGVVRYVGMDISAVALENLPQGPVEVAAVCANLADWDGEPAPVARRVVVASEVLYYDRAAVADLKRLVDETGTVSEVIVSCVAAHPDKPNWAASSDKLWSELAQTGWPEVERARAADPATGVAWDMARYRVSPDR